MCCAAGMYEIESLLHLGYYYTTRGLQRGSLSKYEKCLDYVSNLGFSFQELCWLSLVEMCLYMHLKRTKYIDIATTTNNKGINHILTYDPFVGP